MKQLKIYPGNITPVSHEISVERWSIAEVSLATISNLNTIKARVEADRQNAIYMYKTPQQAYYSLTHSITNTLNIPVAYRTKFTAYASSGSTSSIDCVYNSPVTGLVQFKLHDTSTSAAERREFFIGIDPGETLSLIIWSNSSALVCLLDMQLEFPHADIGSLKGFLEVV